MKIMKMIAVLALMIPLSGCMDTFTRFWNNTGFELSGKEKEIYDICFEEVEKQMRPDPNKWVGDKEQREWDTEFANRLGQCTYKRERAK
ncbi:hypothetical protein A6A10_05235 [Otariodibacter oris]|uniref:Lipoprotein n=2 Tax=Otariodibacter oris TaxID=1032623 RepID=A0A420XI20_9PAST|nr:hypothetical protein A6A10_05235 [Otariodibacter oris]RKR76982.1 hypothetical protein DES31_0295 [Otariodibacter oris]